MSGPGPSPAGVGAPTSTQAAADSRDRAETLGQPQPDAGRLRARAARILALATYAACLAAALASYKALLAAIGGLAAGAAVFPGIWGPFALFALLTKSKAILAWIRAQALCGTILTAALRQIDRALDDALADCKDQFGGA